MIINDERLHIARGNIFRFISAKSAVLPRAVSATIAFRTSAEIESERLTHK